MGTIGNLYEIPGEVKFEWQIKYFSRLSAETNTRYKSSKFYFSGASWEIRICPNGETKNASDGWVSLYVARMSTGFPLTVDYSFSIKTPGGKAYTRTFTNIIDKKHTGWGISKFMMRSALLEKKSRLFPADILTVICTLKNSELTDVVAGSFFSRLQKMSDTFKDAFIESKNTDSLLKVGQQTIGVHRMVLESQAPIFAKMFCHDKSEHQGDATCVTDMNKSTLEAILSHVYSGDIDNLTTENAFDLYTAAVKYDIMDLDEICLKFILRNISLEWVCDIIKFAKGHKLEELASRSRHYFKENADKILENEYWKVFSEENHDLADELVGSLVKGLLQNKNIT